MALKAGYKGFKTLGDGLGYDNVTGHLYLDGESDLTLDNLKDVEITQPLDGDILVYDSTNEVWENEQIDSEPTEDSSKPVSSGGVYADISAIWDMNTRTGVHNLWNEEKLFFTINDNSATMSKTDGVLNVQITTAQRNAGVYIPASRFTSVLSDFAGVAGTISFDVKANMSCTCKVGSVNREHSLTTEWQHIEQSVSDISLIPEFNFYVYEEGITPLISAENLMIRLAQDTDTTYTPYAMTNQQLMENSIIFRRELSSSDDMDNITQNGLYSIMANIPTNYPTGLTYRTVMVYNAGIFIIQAIVNSESLYIRKYTSGTGWGSWYKFEGTIVS